MHSVSVANATVVATFHCTQLQADSITDDVERLLLFYLPLPPKGADPKQKRVEHIFTCRLAAALFLSISITCCERTNMY